MAGPFGAGNWRGESSSQITLACSYISSHTLRMAASRPRPLSTQTDQQVQRVGQRQEDGLLPFPAEPPENDAWADKNPHRSWRCTPCKFLKSSGRPGRKIATDTRQEQAKAADAQVRSTLSAAASLRKPAVASSFARPIAPTPFAASTAGQGLGRLRRLPGNAPASSRRDPRCPPATAGRLSRDSRPGRWLLRFEMMSTTAPDPEDDAPRRSTGSGIR